MISRRCLKLASSDIREIFNPSSEGTINLGIGEPDFTTPRHIVEAAKRALDEGKTHYTPNNGIYELREEICNRVKVDYNLDVHPENVIITCGASEGLMLSLMSLVDRGDEVIVTDPAFLSYRNLIHLCEGRPVPVKLEEDFSLDLEKVKESITDKTKCIVINTPANPTGKVMSKEEIKGLSDIAEDYNVIIISDEVYDKILYQGRHYSPMRYTENCIVVNGFSKTYAMTGWRIGYLYVSEGLNSRLNIIDHMIKIHQYSFACATSFAQYGALAALRGDQSCVYEMVEEFRRRRDLMVKGLRDVFKLYPPEGAFYIFPNTEEYGSGEDVVNRLMERGILAVPGIAFGEGGRYHIRLSYATKYQYIERAVEIIRETFLEGC
ncbi:MAG TPA: pyridoxal phosphate-dependent aminotransferase [Methanothermococcus okinawensis]|uniref:Aminotransferase n=1 Tax=Methanothermococcus okinawensis TaxID=155863 RepID=A0A832ZZS7_9EURY|nr:pyridoxal phosphate-dependent aminotransferase [Methanothermococcus okinawensis]